jgi:tetratricopeptide (TPR) repeat protein
MKAKLLGLIEAGRKKEAEVFLPLVDDSAPARPGTWTIKDTVAHLASWREVAAGELDSVRTGAPAPEVADEDDVQNAKFYDQTHGEPARSILESAARSWVALAEAVKACSEEQLQAARPHHPQLKVWQVVPENAIDHVADHLGYLYSEQGDAAADENAAIWRYDVETAAFPEDRRRGVEEYMLGRFYASKGRRDEAVARLERALALRPELREFASKDPELAGLLA